MSLQRIYLILLYALFSSYALAGDLHYYVLSGNTKALVSTLEQNPALINSVDIYGNTPLHIAAKLSNFGIAALLLDYGANYEFENKRGQKPLDGALQKDKFEELLLEKSAVFSLASGTQAQLAPNLVAHKKPQINKLPKKSTARKNLVDNYLSNEKQSIEIEKHSAQRNLLHQEPQYIMPPGSSLLKSSRGASYAVITTPEGFLGQDSQSILRLAQLLDNGHDPWANNHQNGDWIALKFQKEEFEISKIEALRRTKQLVASSLMFTNTKQETSYVLPIKLIAGKSLWDELANLDPEQKMQFDYFIKLETEMEKSLTSQVHNNFIVFLDNSILKNILVRAEDREMIFIDFPNCLLFDVPWTQNRDFARLCDSDFIRVRASIFDFLQSKEYPEDLQNIYWIRLYKLALKYFNGYRRRENILSAHQLLHIYNVSQPPFLKAIYREIFFQSLSDETIINHVNQYIASR